MFPVSTNLSTTRMAHSQVPPWPPPSTTSACAPVRRANAAAASAGVTGSRLPEITRAGMLEAGTRPHHFGRAARGQWRHTSANSSNGADSQLFGAGAGSSSGFSEQTIPMNAPTLRPLSPRAKSPTAAATSGLDRRSRNAWSMRRRTSQPPGSYSRSQMSQAPTVGPTRAVSIRDHLVNGTSRGAFSRRRSTASAKPAGWPGTARANTRRLASRATSGGLGKIPGECSTMLLTRPGNNTA